MSEQIHDMFSGIARRYDLANDVLSFGIHRLWRTKAVRFGKVKPGELVLDICTGTGDFAYALAKAVSPGGQVVASDFVRSMLSFAQKKRVANGLAQPLFCHADSMSLPFADQSFNAVTVGFGIRNVDDTVSCLRDMKRVLKPQGRAIILEFGQPKIPLFSTLYRLYSKHIMPLIGGLITGDRAAYAYLPESSSEYPAGQAFVDLMQQAGLVNIQKKALIGGMAWIYRGEC